VVAEQSEAGNLMVCCTASSRRSVWVVDKLPDRRAWADMAEPLCEAAGTSLYRVRLQDTPQEENTSDTWVVQVPDSWVSNSLVAGSWADTW